MKFREKKLCSSTASYFGKAKVNLSYLHNILPFLLEFLFQLLPHEDLAPAQSIQLFGVSGGPVAPAAAIGH